MAKSPEPQLPVTVRSDGGQYYSVHAGREYREPREVDQFELAELAYLRDWQAWARERIRGLEAFKRGVDEACNSGNGSYKP